MISEALLFCLSNLRLFQSAEWHAILLGAIGMPFSIRLSKLSLDFWYMLVSRRHESTMSITRIQRTQQRVAAHCGVNQIIIYGFGVAMSLFCHQISNKHVCGLEGKLFISHTHII